MKRENVVHWILWALFSTEICQPEWEDEINEYISEIEGLLGRKLDSGYSDEAKAMRLTLDPVVTLHRPLTWYLVSLPHHRRNTRYLTYFVLDRGWCGFVLLIIDSDSWIQTFFHSEMVPFVPASSADCVLKEISRPRPVVLVPPTSLDNQVAHSIPARHRGTDTFLCAF